MSPSPFFRPLRYDELPIVLAWAEAEGWNPGLGDAEPFFAADPDGFWGMEYKGMLIGAGSTVVYDERIGFVGLFIVKPEWRNRGWGVAFWQFFIDRMKARIGPEGGAALDGVFGMQEKYALSGFRYSHRNMRMEGEGKAGERVPQMVAVEEVPFEQLRAFDRECFGADREAFLRLWLKLKGAYAWAYMEGGRLLGYGVIRPCHRGYKIGPLFASTPEVAEAVFVALSASVPGEALFLDIPEHNREALELAARHGLYEVFGCARMTLGNLPQLPWTRIYGVTTFELG